MKIFCAAAIAVILLGFVAPRILLLIRKRFWLEADAVIIGCDLKNLTDFDGDRIPHFIVGYSYTVGGVQYFGRDVVPIEVPYHEVKFKVDELIESYKPGEKIQIYHPADDPSVSSARRGIVGLPKVLFSATAGIFLILVCYLYWYVRTGQKG